MRHRQLNSPYQLSVFSTSGTSFTFKQQGPQPLYPPIEVRFHSNRTAETSCKKIGGGLHSSSPIGKPTAFRYFFIYSHPLTQVFLEPKGSETMRGTAHPPVESRSCAVRLSGPATAGPTQCTAHKSLTSAEAHRILEQTLGTPWPYFYHMYIYII